MTSLSLPAAAASPVRLKTIYVASILLSAFLLFAVQPMFTRMVLPILGGSPAVWSVAMAFFQALLLAGYVYAHLSTRFLPHRAAALLHALLLAAAFALLPVAIPDRFAAPPESGQSLWLVALFVSAVGLPFFALSATAPLLQAWFGRSGHPDAANPYFLYAASNIGSFGALISYPVLIEPFLPVTLQTAAWQWLFAVLALGLAVCGWLAAPADAPRRTPRARLAIPPTTRLTWIGLAAVPSGLLVAVTAHLATDVASAPFMWVAPLALFLLTFVLVFRDKPVLGDGHVAQLTRYVLPFVLISAMGMVMPLWIQFVLHLGALLLVSMLCHRRLYVLRPEPGGLTEFYLWMSFGGMLGGLFAGLLAPRLFATVLEYPLLVVASALFLPQPEHAHPVRRQLAIAAGLLLIGLVALQAGPRLDAALGESFRYATFIAVAAILSVVIRHRIGSIASAGALAAAILVLAPYVNDSRELAVRSFFGVNYVKLGFDRQARTLVHGSTVHGVVRIADAQGRPVRGRPEATLYYHDKGGITLALSAARRAAGGRLGEVAVLGLGAGALACQAAPGENWTYFEIDLEVARLARNAAIFPFVPACTPDARTIIGDARLTLQRERTLFDVIVLDAFSSDSVPAHLLTREAVAIYAARLTPDGVIIAHVSNRHLELTPVVEAAGLANGFASAAGFTPIDATDPVQKRQFAADTKVVMLSRDRRAVDAMMRGHGWKGPAADAPTSLWTDDYASIIGAMWRGWRR
jgi:hypothetical protein